jgi:hypothetical protein
LTHAARKASHAGISVSEKVMGWSRLPHVWIATISACAVAGWWAARTEAREEASNEPIPHSVAREHGSDSSRERPTMAARSQKTTPGSITSASWMTIPVSWMEQCRLNVTADEFHALLKLDDIEAGKLKEAAGQAMEAARLEQAAEFMGRVMKEGQAIHLRALSDEEIRSHVEVVVSTLPDKLSAAEKELAGFLMERTLREKYGRELEVTLAFTGQLTTSDLGRKSDPLLGFHFVVRPTSPQDEASPMHHSLSDPRFDFLKLDPSVNNQGRSPLDR